MHDSRILDIEREDSDLRLRLDSINASDYASYLAHVIEMPFLETVWPVDLVLRDPCYVSAARVDLRGGLRFADWTRLGKLKFLYDWFFEQDGRLQWIAHLWDHDRHLPRGNEGVYLMVDCAKAIAVDRCAEVFARVYGEPAADLYRDALAGIDETPIDFDVWDDGRKTPEYILRRMAARGLTRADFRPASPARDRDPSGQD